MGRASLVYFFVRVGYQPCATTTVTDNLFSIKTLCLGERSHLTYGKKCTELDGAYPKPQLGFFDLNDLSNDDPMEVRGMCREDWESL